MHPDLVVFDVDGTLQDTGRFWPRVLRRGLRHFLDQRGLQADLPSDDDANAVVGARDAAVWSPFLPPAQEELWSDLRAEVLPLEVAAMTDGGDCLFPGTRELLVRLRELGLSLALASNCHASYLEGVCRGQGLGALTDHQLCLDSPGVRDKADMLRCAIHESQASRAVMVGDRAGDAEAAAEVGIPFIWRANPHCQPRPDWIHWSGEPDELLLLLGLAEERPGPAGAGPRV